MVFSSILFLWVFFPAVLLLYYLLPGYRLRNGLLVLFSLLFYAWGESRLVVLMLISILINYIFGLLVSVCRARRVLLTVCIALNLLILGWFKYLGFLAGVWNQIFAGSALETAVPQISLPIGISFYTFQALSYVIDVYRHENKAQKNLLHLALYISFFPQLIAGPIVKYHDIELQLKSRSVTLDSFTYGSKRFLLGLGKKVILANSFASIVDQVFLYQPQTISQPLLWLTAVLYMMQIYFDFSGYSDMAIGLGKMFGFTFNENFNLPYLSTSIREFWRRWHISLSTWFREYVYIPLGGNRKGKVRTYVNLIIVFLLTGIWHGAGWTFLVWGVYHGFFLVLERSFLGKYLDRGRIRLGQHIYAMLVVLFGWILFRAETLSYAFSYLRWMIVPHTGQLALHQFLNLRTGLLLAAAALCAGGYDFLREVSLWLAERFAPQSRLVLPKLKPAEDGSVSLLSLPVYLAILWICIVLLVNNTYNPFIYFRF